jgi:hypothetical protein
MLTRRLNNYSFNFYSNSKIKYPKTEDDLLRLSKKKYNTIGNLRSYNDAAIGKNPINLKNLNNILNFNYQKKTIEVEAGITINDLFTIILKKKLIIKSVPGSSYVTIGGMIANNTIGKTINKSFIENYIISLKIIHNKKIIKCSLKKNKKLFLSTIGGKGTTGIIISAKLRLDKISSESILVKKVFFNNISDLKSKFLSIKKKEYCVAWVDALSNNFDGIIFFASHQKNLAKKEKRKEFVIPSLVVFVLKIINKYQIFILIFNKIFKLSNYLKKNVTCNIYDFFFSLDTIRNWNKIFEKKGFFQFQYSSLLDNLEDNLKNLKILLKENTIFTNLIIIKFYKKNSKIYYSISLDIPKNSNYKNNCKVFNSFSNKFNLNISLVKDSIIKKINPSTKNSNKFLLYKKYDKNFESKFSTRVKKL